MSSGLVYTEIGASLNPLVIVVLLLSETVSCSPDCSQPHYVITLTLKSWFFCLWPPLQLWATRLNYRHYPMVNFKMRRSWCSVLPGYHPCWPGFNNQISATTKNMILIFPLCDNGGKRNLPKGYLQVMTVMCTRFVLEHYGSWYIPSCWKNKVGQRVALT